jgi:hypothetical protein
MHTNMSLDTPVAISDNIQNKTKFLPSIVIWLKRPPLDLSRRARSNDIFGFNSILKKTRDRGSISRFAAN